jgi:hypothetical protein
MDIYELDSYRLSDAVKFHTELNPALWDGKTMRPEVREALLQIADDFKTFMGIDDLAIEDITVSGSNAAFSYTPHSDIDLHLLVDFSKLNPDDVYQELFNAKKYQYNDQHDIKIRGYDVELYVQDSNKPVRSLGEYSIINNDWNRIPVQRRGNLDEKSTKSKYEKLKELIELALSTNDLDRVTHITDTLKKYRQAGLDKHGEFGPENLAYKMLRTQGYIQRIFDHKAKLEDSRLSLDERKKKKKKSFKYGTFGGYYYPGYHYYGQTDAAADGGGDGGGGESVKESTVNVEKKEIPLDKVVRRFVHFAAQYLKLKQLPKIKLRKGQLSHDIHSMGHYVDDHRTVEVETKDRHVMDILRTLAHELTHYRQHERLGKSMPDTAGRTGSPYENEANAEAGVIMRHFQNRYPEFFASTVSEDDINEGIGRTIATGALAAAAALGQPAQAQDAGRVAYQVGKQIYQPSGIFTRAGAEEEIKGIARDLARGNREIRVGGKRIFGGPQAQGERVAANGMGATPEAAFQDALTRAYQDANRRYGPISVGDWQPVNSEKEIERVNGQYRAAVVIQGPAPVKESASGYIPTKKQARDPRFKTALTVDIKPGQLGKEANKLGLQTDSQGRPDLLMKNLANALKEYKETGDAVLIEGFKAGDVIDLTPNYSAFQTLHGEIQGTGTDGKLRIKIVTADPETEKVSAGTIIKVAPNYVRRSRVINESEQLDEVKMSPSALESWARSPEAEGIRAGFEAEMIFRDTSRDEDEGEMEPDYDYDERARSIDEVIEFFSNDEYGYGMSERQSNRLQEQLDEAYFEWRDGQITDAFEREAEDLVREVWLEERPMNERILSALSDGMGLDDAEADKILAIGDKAPRFTKSSDQTAYKEANPGYDKYLEAVDIADEILDEEVEASISNQDGYYDQALDNFRDDYDEDDSSFFSDVGLRWMSDIANEYGLDWPYYTGGSSGGGGRSWEEIGDSLQEAVGMPVKVGSGYHSVSRKDDRWIVEPDGSLDPDDYEDAGLEIVSPPMPLPMALEKLKQVIEWGNNDADAYTNRSTGLHMGVSIPYVGGDVDYVKLVLFMGDEYVLDKFGRASNTYAASAMNKLRQNMAGARNRGDLTEAKLDPMGALELVQKNLIELAARYVQDGVGNSKYTSAHIKDGYIEFRSPGGDYLSMESRGEYDDIKNTMLRFSRAMYIASRPDLERKEYAKKLYKLISPGAQDDGLKLFSEYAAGTITPEQLKKQWADAVLQKEIPTTGKEEYEVYDANKSRSPEGVIDTFYARDYNSAYDAYTKKWANDPRWSHLDVRLKQPWFDVFDPDGNVVATFRARDVEQAMDKAKSDHDEWTDDWNVYRRPDNTPEPEKKLSARAQIAKRIKEPKVTPAVAADNAQDSQDLQARVGPYSTGTGRYEVVDRRNNSVMLQYTAASDSDAQSKFNNWLTNQGMPQDTENYGWRIAHQSGVQDVDVDVAQNFSSTPGSTPWRDQLAQTIRDSAPRANFELYLHDQPDSVFHSMDNATADEVRDYIERQEQGGMPPGFLRARQVA